MSYLPVVRHLRSRDGTAIYAEGIGNPHHPHLILAHGLGLSSAALNNLFTDKRLLENVYLVRYDLRGHGRSGMPSDPAAYESSRWAEDYAEVVHAFDLKDVIHVGWSYGCTVAADVCAHLKPNPIRALVYVAALPYVGSIMERVGTPTVIGFLPGLTDMADVVVNSRTKIAFIDSLFVHPEHVDFDVKMSWLGQAGLQPPDIAQLVLTRQQDPKRLFEAGKELKMLMLNGTGDKQVLGDVVVKEMSPYFEDMEVVMIKDGAHALWYEKQDEVVEALLRFVERVA